ncbi:MAG TPA: FAD-dependent oxidoreductase [Herpetosiphonaceae bacterium]|nr:FAD-dependent oxidoreductase [Herpetosiphonaceae bacterium]
MITEKEDPCGLDPIRVEAALRSALPTPGHTARTPIGSLHWAGTETSPVWYGKMDGADRSGERVAQGVLAALS